MLFQLGKLGGVLLLKMVLPSVCVGLRSCTMHHGTCRHFQHSSWSRGTELFQSKKQILRDLLLYLTTFTISTTWTSTYDTANVLFKRVFRQKAVDAIYSRVMPVIPRLHHWIILFSIMSSAWVKGIHTARIACSEEGEWPFSINNHGQCNHYRCTVSVVKV